MGDEVMGDAVQGAKKLDRRVVRSRRLIIDAFERLLLKESLLVFQSKCNATEWYAS